MYLPCHEAHSASTSGYTQALRAAIIASPTESGARYRLMLNAGKGCVSSASACAVMAVILLPVGCQAARLEQGAPVPSGALGSFAT